MRKQIVALMLLAVSAVFFEACKEKSRVNELKDFVEEVKEKGGTYTEEQWEKANKKFSEILEKLGKYDDLNTEELKEMGRLQGEYAANVFKAQREKVMEEMEKAGAVINGFFDASGGIDNKNDNQNKKEDQSSDN